MKKDNKYNYHQTTEYEGRLWKCVNAASNILPEDVRGVAELTAIVARILRRNPSWEALLRGNYSTFTNAVELYAANNVLGVVLWNGEKYFVRDRSQSTQKRTKDIEAALKAVEIFCYVQPPAELHAAAASTALSKFAQRNSTYPHARLLTSLTDDIAASLINNQPIQESETTQNFLTAYEDYKSAAALSANMGAGNTVTLYVADDGNIYNGGDNPVSLESLPETVRQGLAMLRIMPDDTLCQFGYRLDGSTFIINK